ncbi:MAG: hypothetical protein ACQGVC_16000 [Myxococcota bacterium]
MSERRSLAALWVGVVAVCVGVRLWNALLGPRMWGYDAWGHVAYVLFIDLYGGLPWPDQGWSYFHPPLHYVLAQPLVWSGDAEVVMRGLALLSSAGSLGVAGLAAWCVRRATPSPAWLAPLAFGAVGLLPAHLLLSPMPGNELTLALLSSACLCVFIANEGREAPRLRDDALAGGLAGLALLTKFSGLLPLMSVVAVLGLRALRPPGPARPLLRALLVVGVALLVAAPYYARNVAAFGSPFQLSRDYPLVSRVEGKQQPGARGVSDYLRFPPAVFRDPDPRSPELLHSVWGTVYANVWADVFRESDVARAFSAHPGAGWMAGAGLLPTVLFLLGAGLALRDVRAGRRRSVYIPLLVHAAAVLGAFAVFAWRVPIWSALKSSYLLGLSLPFGVFLARALLSAPARPWLLGGLAAVGLASAGMGTEGLVLPRRADAPATAAVRFYFGDLDGARRVYARLAARSPEPIPWLDGLAAVALAEGRPDAARNLYARAVALEPPRRWNQRQRRGQLAVATALAGDAGEAAALLDAILAERELAEPRANRGALRARAGDLAGAETDLRRALDANPELVAALWNLAAVHEAAGRTEAAATARARARDAACRAPRRYPHGLGTGEVLEWGIGRRALLLLRDGELALADLDFHRRACDVLSEGA